MDLIKEITEFPAVLKEIYGDLAKPGVQQAGKALSTVIGLGNTVLWPVAMLNEKAKISLEQNLNKYREKLESVPNEDICELPPEVGVPIAEKLSYITNDELSEMYTELLAKASQTSKANVAHPSFVNVINNMSPDEAVLLRSIKGMLGIPFIEVRLNKKGKNEWQTLESMKAGLSCLSKLQHPNNIHAYISNLEGLGVFQVRQDIFMVGDNIYEPLEENAKAAYSHLEPQLQDQEISFQRGKIVITPFARLFTAACFAS